MMTLIYEQENLEPVLSKTNPSGETLNLVFNAEKLPAAADAISYVEVLVNNKKLMRIEGEIETNGDFASLIKYHIPYLDRPNKYKFSFTYAYNKKEKEEVREYEYIYTTNWSKLFNY